MTPAEYQEIQGAFFAVCELPPRDRQAALEERLSSPRLREAVACLLAMDARPSGPFERESLNENIRRALADALASAPAPPPPEAIGPYRVASQIGEGGMGVVFEAVQEHPPRSVALKMIRP